MLARPPGSVQLEEQWYVNVLLPVGHTHIDVNFMTSVFPFFGTGGEKALRSGILLIVRVPEFGRDCSDHKLDRPFFWT